MPIISSFPLLPNSHLAIQHARLTCTSQSSPEASPRSSSHTSCSSLNSLSSLSDHSCHGDIAEGLHGRASPTFDDDPAIRVLQHNALPSVRKLRKNFSDATMVRVKETGPNAGQCKVKPLRENTVLDATTQWRYLRGERLAACMAGRSQADRVTLGTLSRHLEKVEMRANERDRIAEAQYRQCENAKAHALIERDTQWGSDAILCTDAGLTRLNTLLTKGNMEQCLGADLEQDIIADLVARGTPGFSERPPRKATIARLCRQPIGALLATQQNYYAPSGDWRTTYFGSAATERAFQQLISAQASVQPLVRAAGLLATDKRLHTALSYQDFHQSSERPHRVLYKVTGHSSRALDVDASVSDARMRLYSFDAVFSVIGHQRISAGDSSYTQISLRECASKVASIMRRSDAIVIIA